MEKKKIIIVESPAKAKTIEKILGNEFKVIASYGHIRDLPDKEMGIEIKENFKPKYIILPGKEKIIKNLKEEVKNADHLYLATDPDREGEAIAWHITEVLKINEEKFSRIEFHEITPKAVRLALESPRKLDWNKISAQQTRRILDRIVGYELSPFLWNKVKKGLSAGRVQSVALRLVCEREREIENFVPQEYWQIWAYLTNEDEKEELVARLISFRDKEIEIKNLESVERIINEIKNKDFIVKNLIPKEEKKNPPLPFITSTMQQEAGKRFGFPVEKTMRIAQSLYEGIDIGEERIGLITYMRTDSTRIAEEAREEAEKFIIEKYGEDYLGRERKEKKKLGVQGAHEAIRPTSLYREPEIIKNYLTLDQYKLYSLIWERFLVSQMSPAVYDVLEVDISAGDYLFKVKGKTLKFKGYLAIYKDDEEEKELLLPFPLELAQKLLLKKLEPKQFFTQPPSRYTEATLVRTLERNGVGRPSTYAVIISTLKERKYVELKDKFLIPTTLGKIVNDLLVDKFPHLIDIKFTANMEENLDKVEEGKIQSEEVLKEFYPSFKEELDKAYEETKKVSLLEKTEKICPKCGNFLFLRENKYGKFYACSNYPNCEYTEPIYEYAKGNCPLCGAPVVRRISKKNGKNNKFWGCSKYPECSFASSYEPIDRECPKCGNILLKGKIFLKCSNTSCDYIIWTKRRKKQ
ncbi:MAG: type I DNA topoisomerase [Dictyoglomus sp.]|nr:type I DNA topoisomerase [Dictyoglomus sp.]MCX7941609.1 type I DNA topoisomerase [Dictyoglomaceae bacterium]MDW8187772.1 type I DNA topoisomerase [Dictyoglomus sp.]